jgi:hypothetical protein
MIWEQCWSVVILCSLGTVLVSGYIVWFGTSIVQWLYCVVFDQCWSKIIICDF